MTVKAQSVLDGAIIAWDSTAMSGAAKRVSEACELDSVVSSYSFQVDWDNIEDVDGVFEIEECNDGVSWVAVGIVSPTVDDNDGPAMIARNTTAKWARLTYTNASGTGTLATLIIIGKRGRFTGEQILALAAAPAFDPSVPSDWDGPPDTKNAALDELAQRVRDDAFAPDEEGDWTGPPTTKAGALDELAERVTDDAFTPAEAGDWDGPPTTRAGALDELAARLRAIEP